MTLKITVTNREAMPLNRWAEHNGYEIGLNYDAAAEMWLASVKTREGTNHEGNRACIARDALRSLAAYLRCKGYEVGDWSGPLPEAEIARAEGSDVVVAGAGLSLGVG